MSKFTRNEFWAFGSFVVAVIALALTLYIWKNPIGAPGHDAIKDAKNALVNKVSAAGAQPPAPSPPVISVVPPLSGARLRKPKPVTSGVVIIDPKPAPSAPAEPVMTYGWSSYQVLTNLSDEDAIALTPVAYRGTGKGAKIRTECLVDKDGKLQDCEFVLSEPDDKLLNLARGRANAMTVGPVMNSGRASAGTHIYYDDLIGEQARVYIETHKPQNSPAGS